MNFDEGFFLADDGIQLYYRAHLQESNLAVFLIHGYGDHASRYQDLIEELSELPVSWFAFDLRGQGKSSGRRVFAESFDVFVNDLESFRLFILKKFPGKAERSVILGHSLGGLISVQYLAKYRKNFSGAVLSSPCFKTAGISWSAPVRAAGAFLNRFAPKMVLTNFIMPKYLFRNELRMKQYKHDPLIERRVSARLGHLILEACKDAQRTPSILDCPILILASGDDHIVDVEATRRWFSNLTSPSKELKIYPKLYHEIFNEASHEEPLLELKNFLLKQLGGLK